MNNEVYHDIRSTPLAERETFNNTIILLTLVKSCYYYVIGFSRPSKIIEMAFDFESELHASATVSVTLDFGSDSEWVILRSDLTDISVPHVCEQGAVSYEGLFDCVEERLVYVFKIKKDPLIPISTEKMNKYILKAKSEIVTFLENAYKQYLHEV